MISTVLIVPASLVSKADALFDAMGWGSPAFTVLLSPSGLSPATHVGLHMWETPELADWLDNPTVMPQTLIDNNYPETDFTEVMENLFQSRKEGSPHFWGAIFVLGLEPLSDI